MAAAGLDGVSTTGLSGHAQDQRAFHDAFPGEDRRVIDSDISHRRVRPRIGYGYGDRVIREGRVGVVGAHAESAIVVVGVNRD